MTRTDRCACAADRVAQYRADPGTAGSRHDQMFKAVGDLLELSYRGHTIGDSLADARRVFVKAVPERQGGPEFDRAVEAASERTAGRQAFDMEPEHGPSECWDDPAVVFGDDEDDNTPEVTPTSWDPVDLASIVKGVRDGSIKDPVPEVGVMPATGRGLFYRASVNGIAGDSNSGKSWTALVTCVSEMAKGGHALYFDYEDSPQALVQRLVALGASDEDIVQRFHYVKPEAKFTPQARNALAGLLATHSPVVIVIDSTGEGLSVQGANPNADEEVAAWFRAMPRWLADQGAAVVLLDHVPKASDGDTSPVGSHRKRAAITGAQYIQRVKSPFSKNRAGCSELLVSKDRRGTYAKGESVAELHVDAQAEGCIAWLAPAGALSAGEVIRTRILRFLQQFEADWQGDKGEFAGVAKGTVRTNVQGTNQLIDAALDSLVEEGLVIRTTGSTSGIYHRLALPIEFSEEEEL